MNKKNNLDSMEKQHLINAYKTLQGKYNAEVPRLHKELKNVKKINEKLLQQIEDFKLNFAKKSKSLQLNEKDSLKNEAKPSDSVAKNISNDVMQDVNNKEVISKEESVDIVNNGKDGVNIKSKKELEAKSVKMREGSDEKENHHDDLDAQKGDDIDIENVEVNKENIDINEIYELPKNIDEKGNDLVIENDASKEEFFEKVNGKIITLTKKSFQELLKDKKFKEFLNQPDGFTDFLRAETLNNAIEKLNINTVLDICQAFYSQKYQTNSLKPINKKIMHTPVSNNYSNSMVKSQSYSPEEFKKVANSFIKGHISMKQFNDYKKQFDVNAAKELAR